MAFEKRPWSITYTFRDRDDNAGSATVFVDTTLDYVALETKAAALAASIGALSDAPITQYTISALYVDPAAPTPPETSDVERKGRFVFDLDDTRVTSVSVPSFKNTLVIDDSNLINVSDPLVATFVTAVIADGADRIGVDISALKSATKRHIKSSKG